MRPHPLLCLGAVQSRTEEVQDEHEGREDQDDPLNPEVIPRIPLVDIVPLRVGLSGRSGVSSQVRATGNRREWARRRVGSFREVGKVWGSSSAMHTLRCGMWQDSKGEGSISRVSGLQAIVAPHSLEIEVAVIDRYARRAELWARGTAGAGYALETIAIIWDVPESGLGSGVATDLVLPNRLPRRLAIVRVVAKLELRRDRNLVKNWALDEYSIATVWLPETWDTKWGVPGNCRF